MTMTDDARTDDAGRPPAARSAFWHRLARQAALGAAGAVGSGVVTLLVWWLRGG
ncbi:hypothetical protein AB0K92_07605 [Streptomyces sp. NPDC052687]|uniref:hypothetical protein n=1 Tax=unclassified Streptomyces TaxID=2593676 RepID=UPI00140B8775|nr:hypothetical protein [Streptomyces sp. JB150]QIJ63513.1 hypothetical protein G7Z13_16880 [Streptomyces sp. JB150]